MFGRWRRDRPRPSARERLLATPRPSVDSARAGYTAALALLVLLLVGAISVRQVTGQARTRHLIEEGVAALTDIDQVILEYRPELQRVAASGTEKSYAIPGYPIDIRFTRDEILSTTDAQFRDLVLQRSSAYIYTNGLDAFDRNGKQSISLFSSQGVLETLVDWLSEDTNGIASTASIILALLVTVFALAIVLRGKGFARVRSLGMAVVIAGLGGYLASTGVGWVLGNIWGGDPFSDNLHTLITKLTGVPQRNYLITTALGLFLIATGIVCGVASGRLPIGDEPDDAVAEPDY
jgi:hypothetical protein